MKTVYKVVSRDYPNELWASGFFSEKKAQDLIDSGHFHRYMYDFDKHKVLIVVHENWTKN